MTEHEADRAPSETLLAAALIERAQPSGVVFAANGGARAGRLAATARALAPQLRVVLLPAWDCLPFDRVSPSRAIMGARMAALHALGQPGPHLLVAPVEALLQRLPSVETATPIQLAPGNAWELADLHAMLLRMGYAMEDTAHQPGEVAMREALLDAFPPAAPGPARIRFEAGRIAGIDRFDPRTQRRREALPHLTIGPASEVILETPDQDRPPGLEHRLAELAGPLVTPLELLPGAALLLDVDAAELAEQVLRQVDDAHATRVALCRASGGTLPVQGLYLDAHAWRHASHAAETVEEPSGATLNFAGARDPVTACARAIQAATKAGKRVGLSGLVLARALDVDPPAAAGLAALLDLPPGSVARLAAGIGGSVATPEFVLVAASDVLRRPRSAADQAALFATPMRPGDAVVHLDHGIALLHAIETVATGGPADCLSLGFAGDTRELVGSDQLDRMWRYGAASGRLRLDRMNSEAWRERRRIVEAELAATAAQLVELAAERARLTAPVLRAPARRFERFAAGFPHAPTEDQAAAMEDIATDLASGRPMDRLVCGDVGYGKTELALRAAAIAALAGKQVAVLAPTTVLVRQHLATFQRRFAAIGITVAGLSRLTGAKATTQVRHDLASGKLLVVIGTQALAAAETQFANLGLVIVDEEQRFGTRHKAALRGIAAGVHTLTLTATPIPRTLQAALAGLQELSVLATAPARRQPVRTSALPFDAAVLQTALTREHARGGQSFVVCPRIEDLAEVGALLRRLAPGLSVVTLHGKMKPEQLDAAIVGFADGEGDILLSTNIIEAGLDIPRANTMLVWHAERLGLAQLHQLRGRVGRGQARGAVWLFTDPEHPPDGPAAERLAALTAHDGLGAGFGIAARDLDLRGGGDLLGEQQAGHVQQLGLELAQHLLRRALAAARGEPVAEEWSPELELGVACHIPEDYVPDPAERIALHRRLARGGSRAMADELEDRFGPLPDSVGNLLALGRLRAVCRRLGVARLEVGPAAAAATLRDEPPEVPGLERRQGRLLLRQAAINDAERLAVGNALLQLLQGAPDSRAAA